MNLPSISNILSFTEEEQAISLNSGKVHCQESSWNKLMGTEAELFNKWVSTEQFDSVCLWNRQWWSIQSATRPCYCGTGQTNCLKWGAFRYQMRAFGDYWVDSCLVLTLANILDQQPCPADNDGGSPLFCPWSCSRKINSEKFQYVLINSIESPRLQGGIDQRRLDVRESVI